MSANDPFICILRTPDDMCCNCGDESMALRGEPTVKNADGLTFCDTQCADQFDARRHAETEYRRTEWCARCGYDNHEHEPGCYPP